VLNVSALKEFTCSNLDSWILDTVMILEPKLIAQAWVLNLYKV